MPKRRKQESKQQNSKRPKRNVGTTNNPKLGLDAKLPIELQLTILGYLEKEDLKKVRLISQRWCSLAIPLLFNKVYISYRLLDLKTFGECAAHPVISQAIKEVVYDISHFRADLTLEEYLDQLTSDLSKIFYKEKPFEPPNQQFHHYINAVISDPLLLTSDQDEFQSSHANDDFVIEGYRVWRKHAKFEKLASRKGILSAALCYGFGAFVNLRSVIVENCIFKTNRHESRSMDRSTLSCTYSGSPVTRGWNPLHARPNHRDNKPDNIDRHFRTIAQALSVTKRTTGRIIPKFRVLLSESTSLGLPVTTLQTTEDVDYDFYWAIMGVCANLKSFAIRTTIMDRGEFLRDEALGMLPDLLADMEGLENLEVDLQGRFKMDHPDHVSHHNFDQLFPFDNTWPHLVSLHISGLSTKASVFLTFLAFKLPKLRRLSLNNIELLDGHWEGVISMMAGIGLDDFTLAGCVPCLTSRGRLRFEGPKPDADDMESDFFDDIEDYVVNGGRHPCLPPNSESRNDQYYSLSLMTEEDKGKFQVLLRGNGIKCPSDPGSIARLTPIPSDSRI